jgi:hypothetical protein
MSRRYGRNQKHKHLARIAELERRVADLTNDAAMWKQRAELLAKRATRAEDVLATVVRDIESVAHHSALLEPKQSGIDMSADSDKVLVALREEPRWVDLARNPPRLAEIQINTIDLWRIRLLVREVPAFRTLLHLFYRAGGQVAYAITDETLAHLVRHRGPVYAMQEILKIMLYEIGPMVEKVTSRYRKGEAR